MSSSPPCTDANPQTITGDVRDHVRPAAESGRVPVLVAPGRDCGGASGGGAAELNAWQTWIAGMADGLDDARAIVVLEPDALALEDCLDGAQASARHAALAAAVTTVRDADPRAEVIDRVPQRQRPGAGWRVVRPDGPGRRPGAHVGNG